MKRNFTLQLKAYPGDDLVIDILSKGELGVAKLLRIALTIAMDDFVQQSHSCRLAVVAQLFSSTYTVHYSNASYSAVKL